MKGLEKKLEKKTVFVFRSVRERNSLSTDPTVSSILITVTGGVTVTKR